MKKFYIVTVLLLFAFFTKAQITVQGIPRNDLGQKPSQKMHQKKVDADFSFSDIIYWVGSGENEAALVVQWNDGKNPDALVWGFRWDGNATGEDMIQAIAKADKRFYTLVKSGTQYGTAIGGFGFDLDGKGSIGLYKNNNTTYPLYPLDGVISTEDYDFDDYTAVDSNDHWQSGWVTNGYWSYYVKDDIADDFGYSNVGASSRILQNGSWDAWNFLPGFEVSDISSTFTPVSAYVANADFSKGFFMVNEEWYGHTNGSVNFVSDSGDIYYRVYSNNNDNNAFGATTQYGTIYGNKFYFISKQQADGGDTQYTPGGRLVIADPYTMKKTAGFDNIGGGDGRSFVGVDEHKGYIGATNGIFLFDIDNLKVGSLIAGTGGGSTYNGQIGNMIRTAHYVYAVKQSAGILIIDPETDTLIKTISGTFHSITQAKDGSIWAIQDQTLVNISENDFSLTEYPIPTTKYIGAWGAWNAGSFTYSNQQNALFWINSINTWTSGTQIVKFDVDTKTFNENFATIPGQDSQYKQIPYGAALRVNPVSGELILNTTESGYGAHYQKNWVYTYDTSGNITDTKTLNDYYWFPAITVFPDNEAPVLDGTLPDHLSLNESTTIDLKNAASDTDNLSTAIVKRVKSNSADTIVKAEISNSDELLLTPLSEGSADIVLSFNSNGKVVEKTISVTVGTLAVSNQDKQQLGVYPNPVVDILYLSSPDKISEVYMFDLSGREIPVSYSNGQINLSRLPGGVYILRVKAGAKTFQQKVIKK